MSAPASSSLDASCQDTERLRIHLKQSSKGMHEAICEAACGPVDVAIPRAVNSERNCDTKLVIARSIQSWISGFRIDRFCAHSIRRLFLWAGTLPRPRIRRTTGGGNGVSAAGRDGLELFNGEAGHCWSSLPVSDSTIRGTQSTASRLQVVFCDRHGERESQDRISRISDKLTAAAESQAAPQHLPDAARALRRFCCAPWIAVNRVPLPPDACDICSCGATHGCSHDGFPNFWIL